MCLVAAPPPPPLALHDAALPAASGEGEGGEGGEGRVRDEGPGIFMRGTAGREELTKASKSCSKLQVPGLCSPLSTQPSQKIVCLSILQEKILASKICQTLSFLYFHSLNVDEPHFISANVKIVGYKYHVVNAGTVEVLEVLYIYPLIERTGGDMRRRRAS